MLCDAGRIVGFLGCIPSRFQLHGAETIAYNATTWRVDEDYRSESLKLMFQMNALSKDAVLFDTTPTPHVIPIIETMGFEEFPPDWQFRCVYLLRVAKAMRARLARFPLLQQATWIAVPMVKTFQTLRTWRLRRYGLSVRELSRADAEFDALWERTRARYVNTNVRTAREINWHCFHSQNFRKLLLGCYDGDRLVGYAVCCVEPFDSLVFLRAADIWADFDVAGVVEVLVDAMRHKAEELGCDALEITGFNRDVSNRLTKTGLMRFPMRSTTRYWKLHRTAKARLPTESRCLTNLQGDYRL
jgi:hypothetical protein